MPESIPRAGALEAARWLLRKRRRFVVRGRSMLPTLPEGATVLVEPGATPSPGDVVVTRHPYVTGLTLIKRVAAVHPDGRAELRGDNPGESSHAFGTIRLGALVGVVRSQLAS